MSTLHLPVLETQRLLLRPPCLGDAPAIQRRFAHWEIVRHLSTKVPWPYPEDGAETFLRMTIPRIEAGEICAWAICRRDAPDDAIGWIELRPFNGIDRDMRGFWLAQEFQGRGCMTEAANRVTDFAFRKLGWPFLWVANATDNRGSARVKERQGAVLVDTEMSDYVEGRKERQVWRIDAADWLARMRNSAQDSK
ncbi:MAG: GNAT family N-acetyltransferase [Vitreimonas sp.]